MKYILIMIIAMEGNSPAVSTAEFDGKLACERAAAVFTDLGTKTAAEAAWFGTKTRRFADCVPKAVNK